MSERETVVELPFAADCCPCVEKLRTVSPVTVGIRDGVVHLVLTQRVRTCSGACVWVLQQESGISQVSRWGGVGWVAMHAGLQVLTPGGTARPG
jgi:hypothetical protein